MENLKVIFGVSGLSEGSKSGLKPHKSGAAVGHAC